MHRAHIVYIQAQVMRGAMHEVFFVGRPGRILIFDVRLVNQTQAN